MAIWATLDDYLPMQPGQGLVGRSVANYSFLQALLRYSHFEEFHFFLANRAHMDAFQKHHKELFSDLGVEDKIKLYERLELPLALRANDYTVFHLSDHITSFSSLCFLRNRYGNFPVSASIHSLSYQRFMRAYTEYSLGGICEHDLLLCSSQAGKEVVQKCLREVSAKSYLKAPDLSFEVIPLGLDGQTLPKKQVSRESLRHELGVDRDAVIGLSFGRFSDVDKMDILPVLNAFAQIARENPKAHLWLAGATQEKEYLQILQLWIKYLDLSGQVSVFENPSDENKWRLYEEADFFLSLSDNPQETFGITLIEAMAFGLPLLVSDYDGYKNLITDAIALKVPTLWNKFPILEELSPFLDERTYHRYLGQSLSFDFRVFREHLNALYSNAEQRAELGANARREFMQKYDYRVIVPALEHLWREAKNNFKSKGLQQEDPTAMRFSSVFEHYPTAFLADEQELECTDFAREWLAQEKKYPLLFALDSIFSWQEALTLLGGLEGPCLVKDIVDRYSGEKWKCRYIISWLLKHGFLELTGDNYA